MIRISGDCQVPEALKGGAVALGNFDGVHCGHQAVIGAAVKAARAAGRPALVATFDPHPSRHFRPDTPPFALTRIDQRLDLFAELGVDAAVVIPFDAGFASLSAEAFGQDWLAGRLAPFHVVTGEDFTFGKGRSGNTASLAEMGRRLGFTAEALSPVTDVPGAGAVISSTRIREALAAGDMAEATRLLSRPFTIRMPVIHGEKKGRTIGVPTINQELGPYMRPRYGVYAVRVQLPDGSRHSGVASLGIRPMFDPPRELMETWILDWSGDLYGQEVAVELIAFLRPELWFDGLDSLKVQIEVDVVMAREAITLSRTS